MTKITHLILAGFLLLFAGCATQVKTPTTYQDKNTRTALLSDVNQWQIKGKVAFLSDQEKQSANLFWRQTDEGLLLKLTTFLGINILSIEQQDGLYTLKSDGKTFKDENLETLLTQATGLIMPVSAMKSWLKGLKATSLDEINYDPVTELPASLETYLNHQHWQLHYNNYMPVAYNDKNYVQLASKMTLKHNRLTIKVAIHSWDLIL